MAHSLGGCARSRRRGRRLDDGSAANDHRRIRCGAALSEKRKLPCEMGSGVQERRAFERLGGELAPVGASG
jgi:hypothetical protein